MSASLENSLVSNTVESGNPVSTEDVVQNTEIRQTDAVISDISLNESTESEADMSSQIDTFLQDHANDFPFVSDENRDHMVQVLLANELMTIIGWEELRNDPQEIKNILETEIEKQEKIIIDQNVNEEKQEVHEDKQETQSFQSIFDAYNTAHPEMSASEILDHFLSPKDNAESVNIPEQTRQRFLEYQKLLNFGKTNEHFTAQDNATVETVVRRHLASPGGSIQSAVQELYESPDLTDEAREALAQEFGRPRQIMQMKTETDIENAALEKDKIKKNTEKEIKDLEDRTEALQNKKDSGEPLSDDEEKELAEKQEKLKTLQAKKEQLKDTLDTLVMRQ